MPDKVKSTLINALTLRGFQKEKYKCCFQSLKS